MVSACCSARSSSAVCSARISAVDRVDRRAQVQAHVGRDLVVARTAGVQALAGVADQLGQPLLDVEVHVLEVDRPGERAGADLGEDLRHAALDVGEVLGGQHADRVQHARVRERAVDVELGQSLVEVDRCGVALDELVDRLAEAAGPGFAGR